MVKEVKEDLESKGLVICAVVGDNPSSVQHLVTSINADQSVPSPDKRLLEGGRMINQLMD